LAASSRQPVDQRRRLVERERAPIIRVGTFFASSGCEAMVHMSHTIDISTS
jgi:hypothetical protein